MMRYAESIAIQNERKAEKTMLADFGIEPKPQRTLTELQIAAYTKRKKGREMTKLFSELVPGDIIRTVYGDFDNWVTVEVISIKKEPPVTHPNGRTTQWMAVECKYARKIPYEHDKPFEMWSYVDSKVQIIDKEDLK